VTACCAASIFSPRVELKVTLRAPRAANVSSSKRALARPRITKDGVTVAKEIELEDKSRTMGAQMVR